MPTWGEMLKELAELKTAGNTLRSLSPVDVLRRKYLKQMHELTGRALIVYGTCWLEARPDIPPSNLSIGLGDMHGFMEACSNVSERELDLVLSSPGGTAEAADSIMAYLRTRFDHIRTIVPVAAMSAATMMALSSDVIVMGAHSQLGPIDPQFTISTPDGPRSAPGQAVEDQFARAKEECADPKNIAAWIPLLRGLMPGLLAQCDSARDLSKELVRSALVKHMFAGSEDGESKAKEVAEWFSDFKEFKSHGRRVGYAEALDRGLQVEALESDASFQDAVLSVYHALRLTFSNTPAVKIVENHNGRAYIEQVHVQQVAMAPQNGPKKNPSQPRTPGNPGPNRQQRRQQQRGKNKR